jgi:predicted permease
VLADLRFALRSLAKAPGFNAVAILSLALGIGANTAVFSVMNAVLLQTLPVKAPEQLVLFNWLAEENVSPPKASGWPLPEPGTNKFTHTSFSVPMFESFQQQPGPLSDVFAFAPLAGLNVNIDGAAEIVPSGQVASANYHTGLGVTAAAGRLFAPDDDRADATPVAVISYRYWQRRFGGDSAALGKSITVNGAPFTIIGVTAPSFNGTLQVGEIADLTLHDARLTPRAAHADRQPDYWWVRIMGRLKPGATPEQARLSLEGVFRDQARGNVISVPLHGVPAFDSAHLPLPQLRVARGAQGLYEARRGYERSLYLLMAIVGLVLLVACANVANLLLARGAARRREIAVRLALGASRARLVGQLLAESMLLAVLGAAAGILVSLWGVPALLTLQPFGSGAVQLDPSLDGRVLGFTTAVAIATGLVFGLAPALRATRLDLTSEFQGGGRPLGVGSRSALAKSLMIAQVALSVILLVAAGLFVRTLRNLRHVDLGFNGEQLLLFQIDVSVNGASAPQVNALFERMQARLATLPGIRRASYARLSQETWNYSVTVPGYASPTGRELVKMNGISPDYLPALELPLLRGRNFTPHDNPATPAVTIVNQSFAKKYFGTEDVIGRRFTNSAEGGETEIVGLMPDTLYANARMPAGPVVFFPYAQLALFNPKIANFAVRFTGPPDAIATSIRAAAREVDASLPVTNLRTQQQQLDRQFASERLFATLCSLFGLLTLLLVAIGIYGLMSYAVVRRTGEIGLRVALGALPGRVQRMIVQESLALVAVGLVVGLAAALGASRFVGSMLFGLTTTDPLTYSTTAFLIAVVALLACWIPAHRATKVDPMIALRAE